MNGVLNATQSSLSNLSLSYNSLSSKYNNTQLQLTSTESQLTSTQTDLSSANSRITKLESYIQTQNNTISVLQSQVTNLQSQLSSMQAQASTLQSQELQANNQASSLQSQITSQQNLLNLQNVITETNNQEVNAPAGAKTQLADFSAPYAGYLTISGTTSSSNTQITVTDTAGASSLTFNFGSGGTLYVPIVPGTIDILMSNSNLVNGMTATISITYTD